MKMSIISISKPKLTVDIYYISERDITKEMILNFYLHSKIAVNKP